jgi:protein SCO1/2
VLLLAACGEDEPALETLFTVPAFELTDQDGAPFGTAQLRGRVWIASFLFTSCGASCPTLAAQLANVSDRLAPFGDRVRIVSLTVDPATDTPERLRAFGERFGADFGRWTFLTGAPDTVREVHQHAFLQPEATRTELDVAPGYDVFHGTAVLLFDTQLRCRGIYRMDRVGHDTLVRDVGRLLE